MSVRASMADLIEKVRLMVADPAGASQQFDDQTIQDYLDETRDDVRYLLLSIAPSIVNAASTANVPSTIFADYYSDGYQWWESDVVLQGNNTTTGASWIVLTPTTSDYIVGHWTFEANVFTSGTVPGQYPPIFATGKTYDLNAVASDLLKFWAAALASCSFDFSSDGQSFKRSQIMQAKLTMADYYARKAKPRMAKMVRRDVARESRVRELRLLDSDDLVRGGY